MHLGGFSLAEIASLRVEDVSLPLGGPLPPGCVVHLRDSMRDQVNALEGALAAVLGNLATLGLAVSAIWRGPVNAYRLLALKEAMEEALPGWVPGHGPREEVDDCARAYEHYLTADRVPWAPAHYRGMSYPGAGTRCRRLAALRLALHRRFFCRRGWHLFDEAWGTLGHKLVCDACGLEVGIGYVEDPEGEKGADDADRL